MVTLEIPRAPRRVVTRCPPAPPPRSLVNSASASNLYDDEEVEYTAAQQTRDVASGDLDGDTHVDLVSVSASDGRVIWYRNRGFGAGFETRRIIADHGIVRDSTAVAVGDIDGDGFLDVITRFASAGLCVKCICLLVRFDFSWQAS